MGRGCLSREERLTLPCLLRDSKVAGSIEIRHNELRFRSALGRRLRAFE